MARAKAENRPAAVKRYKGVLQEALGCVSPTIWITPETTERRGIYALKTADPVLRLRRVDGGSMLLQASQLFRIVPDDYPDRRGEFRIRTLQYIYTLSEGSSPDAALIEWHWHPDKRPLPHVDLHMDHPVLGKLGQMHVPSGRVSFEEVIRFLIADLEVEPGVSDWEKRLDRCQRLFEDYRSWTTTPPAAEEL